MPKSRSFNVANMSFNAIRENKILSKISEFTVILDTCTGSYGVLALMVDLKWSNACQMQQMNFATSEFANRAHGFRLLTSKVTIFQQGCHVTMY